MSLKDILAAVGGVKADLRGKKDKMATLIRAREELLTLPPPRSEFEDQVCKWLDVRGRQYPKRLEAVLAFFLRNPLHESEDGRIAPTRAPVPLLALGSKADAGGVAQLEEALYYLQAESLKKELRRAIGEMAYPDVAGPPRKERLARLERLEVEINALEALIKEEEDALQSIARG